VEYALSNKLEIIDRVWPWRLLRAVVAKQCEIGPKLPLITNRKWHIGFQIIRSYKKSLTFYDLKGHWQLVLSAVLATAGLLLFYFCRSVRALSLTEYRRHICWYYLRIYTFVPMSPACQKCIFERLSQAALFHNDKLHSYFPSK